MLELKESLTSDISHQFKLTSIGLSDKISFVLGCDTYEDLNLEFILDYQREIIPNGYSVDVHLFKNIHYSQMDIIDLRINELSLNKGKVGYFFRLDALFEKDILKLNKHIYPYAYYALEYIFSEGVKLQTKDIEITTDKYEISDFFDDNTIVLVVCNQITQNIHNFNIHNYLAPLYLNAFVKFDKLNEINKYNLESIISDNYSNVRNVLRSDGCFVLRVGIPEAIIINESFIQYLFANLVQRKFEPITRFIMLYQVIEITISKILHLKVQSEICGNLNNFTSFQLKEFLGEVQKEKKRITWTINEYSKLTSTIDNQLKDAIFDFFIHVQDVDYNNPAENSKLTLVDVFYDYRNKLVHNYRLIHSPGIDKAATESKMEKINDLGEIMVSQIISTFKTV